MIRDLKNTIKQQLSGLYTEYTIYEDEIPEIHETPAFLVQLTGQEYNKRLSNNYQSILSFDVTYYSNQEGAAMKTDEQEVQLTLLRAFETVPGYRIQKRKASILEQVLHLTFEVVVHERKTAEAVKMQQSQLQTKQE